MWTPAFAGVTRERGWSDEREGGWSDERMEQDWQIYKFGVIPVNAGIHSRGQNSKAYILLGGEHEN
jgi:hypothetical protein